jgi:hypothetical protein
MKSLRATFAATLIALALSSCTTSYDDAPRTAASPAAGPRVELTDPVLPAPPVQEIEPAVVVDAKPQPKPQPEPTPAPELVPGPTLYGPGDKGPEVREIQARLRQIAWFYGDVTDFYGDQTTTAVAGFQTKREIPSTGEVDQRTLDRLLEMTSEPTADELANVKPDPADGAALDPRCLTGRVLCIDKTSSSLRWVVDGEVEMTLDARFGGDGHFTREGLFHVFLKDADHVSSLYDTSMPYAMFFSGGEAVHYSPDFAANGYNGSSHGCVNIRDYDAMVSLFDQVQLGDAVVVYWS